MDLDLLISIFFICAASLRASQHILGRRRSLTKINFISGLFRAAIVESGSALVTWAINTDPKAQAYLIADLIPGGTYGNDTQALKDFLKNRTIEEIMTANQVMTAPVSHYSIHMCF